jgi:PAS domain S-box-containing protein
MKIRTRINLWLLLTALLIPGTFFLAWETSRSLDIKMREMADAEKLINSLAQLRMIAVETTLYHEARASDQWQRKVATLQTELKRLPTSREIDRARVDRFLKRITLAQTIYARLAALPTTSPTTLPAAGGEQTSNAEQTARTVTALFVVTQEMNDIGYEIIADDQLEVKAALFRMQLSMLVVILVLAGSMLFVWRLISRGVLAPLQQFERGAQSVAAGDYSYILNLSQKDEIGKLASAFDAMTDNVQSKLIVEVENSQRAEAALAESAQFTQTILDNAGDGIITIDKHGMIQSVNLAVKTIFGYHPNELLGHNIKCLMPEPFHSEHDGYLNNYQETGVAKIIGMGREVEGRRKNGDVFPMDLTVSHTRHRGADLFVGLIRDISERKQMDQMKAEFVSTVSHELRTPLTSINGALGLIMGGVLGEAPLPMRKVLDIAHKNSLLLARLIDDLLNMEKLLAGKFQFDLRVQSLMALIDQSVESSAPYAERFNVAYCITERLEQVAVYIDSHRLQQVMANFLSNAAKFSPSPGQVEIKVTQTGENVRVSVIDHGPGIPLSFQARIFQKFSQADSSDTRSKGGTGLGLAISKELIERMGGRIGFDSTPGVGTCFYFELPAVSTANAGGENASPDASGCDLTPLIH